MVDADYTDPPNESPHKLYRERRRTKHAQKVEQLQGEIHMDTRRSFSLVILILALAVCGTLAVANFSTKANAVDPLIAVQDKFEYDTNRSGSDYRTFETQADPTICRNECAKDPTCRAYTYVKPGVQGPNAKCWLKNTVPGASVNNCCVSGVKTEAVSGSGLEVDVNRRGGDYRHYDLPSNNPNQCRDDCMNDPKCKSFTYLRPSYWGPNAHCFLKENIPGATAESCCISGVKPGATSGAGGDARVLEGVWDFVCCSGAYTGGIVFQEPTGNRFKGYFYRQDHPIEGEINGRTVTFKRTFSGGSQDYTMTLSADGRTLSGSFTGDAPANLTREVSATKRPPKN
jgi:hypothetical protein